jgi:hypothetical protein
MLSGFAHVITGVANCCTYVKAPDSMAACPSGFVTTTSTAPAAYAGVVAVMVVASTTTTLVAPTLPRELPRDTVPLAAKLAPVIVMVVPPAVVPPVGVRPTIDGGAAA